MKPRIGVSMEFHHEPERYPGATHRTYDRLKRDYLDFLESAGALPVYLPNVRQKENAMALIELVDGLLLSGGDDISPQWFGEEAPDSTCVIHAERDESEIVLVRSAIQRNIPILGICRGEQLLNVAMGGTLHQDLRLRPGTGSHRNVIHGCVVTHDHDVMLQNGTRLRELAGVERIRVNSTHHQLVAKPAPGFAVAALAEDGAIEAIERITEQTYLLGVQWHPEALRDEALSKAIIADFLKAAGLFRNKH